TCTPSKPSRAARRATATTSESGVRPSISAHSFIRAAHLFSRGGPAPRLWWGRPTETTTGRRAALDGSMPQMTDTATADPIGEDPHPYSPAIAAGGFAFVSGALSIDTEGVAVPGRREALDAAIDRMTERLA